MQQLASEREANGRKAALADFRLGLGNPYLGRHDASSRPASPLHDIFLVIFDSGAGKMLGVQK